jgi:uncharacterized protein
MAPIGRDGALARPGLSVALRPPSTKRVHLSHSLDGISAHVERIKDIPPEDR